MSHRGQHQTSGAALSLTATELGEIEVEEYPYGLGPPTGILAFRYPPTSVIADFPESRNDFVHQVYWSPDGVLAVGRGGNTTFVGPDDALWVRRGAIVEVTAMDVQTVLRFCVREAPDELQHHAAMVLPMTGAGAAAARSLVRPGTSQQAGLAARVVLLDELAHAPADPVAHQNAAEGSARIVARALAADPADPTSLAEWADRLHVSTKTLQREFERDYGLSFSAWRIRTRLDASVAMLARWSITETAHRVGYATASSYVSAFTREYGHPPGQHLAVRAS